MPSSAKFQVSAFIPLDSNVHVPLKFRQRLVCYHTSASSFLLPLPALMTHGFHVITSGTPEVLGQNVRVHGTRVKKSGLVGSLSYGVTRVARVG